MREPIPLASIHFFVMAGLVPAIHVLARKEDVDARAKPAHDAEMATSWCFSRRAGGR